jgi:aryl-alcohol dehydrogenase-like predicted oxidoreductase
MNTPSASRSGQFAIGKDLKVHRLGFGAMRITGKGIWGPPADRSEALRTLRRLRDLDVVATVQNRYNPSARGTGQVAHLDENVAAASIELSDVDFKALAEG